MLYDEIVTHFYVIIIYFKARCLLVCFKIWTSVENQVTAITDDVKISLEGSTAVVTEASLNQMTARPVLVRGTNSRT